MGSWKHFGKEILQHYCNTTFEESTLHMLWMKMYDGFVEEVDGVDNGVNPYSGDAKYIVSTSISKRVSRLYPAWNEPYSVPSFASSSSIGGH